MILNVYVVFLAEHGGSRCYYRGRAKALTNTADSAGSAISRALHFGEAVEAASTSV
jgi:hypothetical protein